MGRGYRTGQMRATLGVALAVGLTLGGCNRKAPSAGEGGPAAGTAGAAASPCPAFPSPLKPVLPGAGGSSEVQLACFAWQSFVAVNWRADPSNPGYPDPVAGPDTFGTEAKPAVWETYLEASAVFGPPLQGGWRSKRPATLSLTRTSKFGNVDLSDIDQAGTGHHWLTSQRGEVTYYQVMLNPDEYEFITSQKFDLTTAEGQRLCASQPGRQITDGPPPPKGPFRGGLTLPEGQSPGWVDTDCLGNVKSYGKGDGAMEIKAAWTPLPADHSLDYRYKTALAEIQDPVTKTKRTVTVGLVGLHIARKRVARHQWTWATFEHIDNSPDEAANGGFSPPSLPPNPNRKPGPAGYTFFNPNCTPARDPVYKCQHNLPPTPCGPSGLTCNPYNAPMQVTRINAVDAVANQVTAYYWSQMPAASVYNYYRLISIQWPQTPGMPNPSAARTPLPMGDPMPKGNQGGTGQILANTTLETFQQKSNACMDCHVYAPIASPPQVAAAAGALRKVVKAAGGPSAPYAADYSFVFVSETKR